MVRKLRKKFILISVLSTLAVLVVILGIINFVSYYNARVEIFSVMSRISDSGGLLPEQLHYRSIMGEAILTEESRYSIRYFSALVDDDGLVYNLNRDQVSAIDENAADEYVKKALKRGSDKGFLYSDSSTFAYQITQIEDAPVRLCVIMDCTRQLRSSHMFFLFSVIIGVVALLMLTGVLILVSGKVVSPLVRNMESQKQFITNASHELKTPLAIISANTEVLEMTEGENEWTKSTLDQVKRMSELISRLITLSRLQEKEEVELSEADYTGIVRKVTDEFRVVAENDGKQFQVSVDDHCVVRAHEAGLREMVSVLVDNAVKYCSDGGEVRVEIKKKGHLCILNVSNSYPEKEGVDYSRFFERFYREDESHNSGKKGFGIGLSMAEQFVDMFKGKISVGYRDGMIRFTVTFPSRSGS